MDPRTASALRSIWRPLNETQFQQNISALWKITKGIPKDPQTYRIGIPTEPNDEIFLVSLELQLAESIAFISARHKGVESVSAVMIERPQDPSDGLRLNLAANEKIHQTVKDRIDEVVTLLRETARGERTRDQCRDDVLHSILQLNRARIYARLKSRKSRSLVRDGMLNVLISLAAKSGDHDILVKRLQTLCKSLRGYCDSAESSKTLGDVERLVTVCHDFFDVTTGGQSVKSMLAQVGVDIDDSRGNPHLRQIGKIASYRHAAETLSTIASDRELRRLCVNFTIQYIPAYRTVQSPITAVDRGSRDCRVHAEVQLVVDQDLREPSNWRKPRTIGSSKAPCFLCELFINEHKGYIVPRTHGKLTPRWTLPDLNKFSSPQLSQYRNIIGAMNRELQRLVGVPHPRRLEAAMSWQALSRLNVVLPSEPNAIRGDSQPQFVPAVAADPHPPEPANDGLMPLSLPLLEPALVAVGNEVEGLASQPRSDSAFLPIKHLTGEPSGTGIISREGSHDHLWPTGGLGAERGTSPRSSDIEQIPRLHDSPVPKIQRQVRSFTSLDSKQLPRVSRVIRDHESRSYDMPSEPDLNEGRPFGQLSMPYSDGMNRRIDFHDMDLLLEIEYPATLQIGVIQCSKPNAIDRQLVIDVDKVTPGATHELDAGLDSVYPRIMFLTKRDNKGIDRWWECCWEKAA